MFVRALGAASMAIILSGCVWFPFGDDVAVDAVPNISFLVDEETGRLSVQSASSNADWNRLAFEVRGCDASAPGAVTVYAGSDGGQYIRHNVEAAASGAALNEPNQTTGCGIAARKGVADAPAPVNAGDFISLCTSSNAAGTSVENVEVQAFDLVANAIVLVETLERVPPCTA